MGTASSVTPIPSTDAPPALLDATVPPKTVASLTNSRTNALAGFRKLAFKEGSAIRRETGYDTFHNDIYSCYVKKTHRVEGLHVVDKGTCLVVVPQAVTTNFPLPKSYLYNRNHSK